ncbi:hypothetical protein GAY29_24985 [Azospirillum brasilense]|uniref:class I SAM-dependent methyltransferase n=1 Tax=Azospirillum brasilense TaxID=192 RepID=UPI00190A6541|nr:hypothetical protein [Azospirillum brasilense]MBK3736296.1 hypothetical protein [Azospirillum brasilense]
MSDLKLNLGCGDTRLPGYVNVDKYGTFGPDIQADLEAVPWPFETNSVADIQLIHALEHMGQTTGQFLNIMTEMHRVCRHGARITIKVPHPRSDGFLGDPTHVRPITPNVLSLFSMEENRKFIERGWPNTRLAMHLNVDFRILSVGYKLMPRWQQRLKAGQVTNQDIAEAIESQNNVVDEITIVLEAVKDAA